jgi:undecaprenyl-diphosphatase
VGVQNLDTNILLFINSFAGRWLLLDRIVEFFNSTDLVRGCPVMAAYFFAWFQSGETANTAEAVKKRQTLLYTLLACVPGLLITRILSSTLPFRERPFDNPMLQIRRAFSFDPTGYLGWSSFPSDHAVLFFALATGMYLVNRKLGILLYLHAVVVISLPRIFVGIHYPSDIVAGALLGIGLAYPAKWDSVRITITRPVFQLVDYSPGFFYVCLLFLAYETAGLYWNLIHLAMALSNHLKHFLHH